MSDDLKSDDTDLGLAQASNRLQARGGSVSNWQDQLHQPTPADIARFQQDKKAQQVMWERQETTRREVELRGQALTGALHTHGAMADHDAVIAAAHAYLAFLNGETEQVH